MDSWDLNYQLPSFPPPSSPLESPMGLGAPELSGVLWAAAFQGSSLVPGESTITLTHSQEAKRMPPMAGEQFVFVVLCTRNKIFFSPRSHLAVCPLANTHPRSAAGSPELCENKEVLAGLPQSGRDRLIHPYGAGQEAQSNVQTWGRGLGHLRILSMSPAPQQQVRVG